jgi:hypothetical protein
MSVMTLPRGAEPWRLPGDLDEDALFAAKAELEDRGQRGEDNAESTAAYRRVLAELERCDGPRARAWQAEQWEWTRPGGGLERNNALVRKALDEERASGVFRESVPIGRVQVRYTESPRARSAAAAPVRSAAAPSVPRTSKPASKTATPDWYIAPPTPVRDHQPCEVSLRMAEPTADSPEIRIGKEARGIIADAAWKHQGDVETGGGLYGHRGNNGRLTLFRADVAAYDQEHSSMRLDVAKIVHTGRDMYRDNNAQGEFGSWHCHPDIKATTPSRADLTCWISAYDAITKTRRLDHYFGVLVTPERRGYDSFTDTPSWATPTYTAYAVSRDDLGRAIAERASVVRLEGTWA